MLDLSKDLTIYLAVEPVDMRRAFDGLSAIVQEQLELNPLSGSLFVFRNKNRDRIKILRWDRNGLVLYYKRLERGRFRWPKSNDDHYQVTTQELELLLDGVDFTKLKRLPSYQFEAVI